MLYYNTFMTRAQTLSGIQPAVPFPPDSDHGRMCSLADRINRAPATIGTPVFRALPLDHALFDAPTFSVDVQNGGVTAATYRYNYSSTADGRTLLLHPLVIQWADGGAHRTAGLDAQIINHAVSSLRSYLDDAPPDVQDIRLTSGYLTVQRDGKNFFNKMGWDIYHLAKENGAFTGTPLPAPLQDIAARIDAVSLPHRTTAEEAGQVCFASLLLRRR